METGRGTIIRLTKLTESSLIVHWMSEEGGLLKTVAKGARRAKSPFAGRLDLFVEADFQWVRSRRSELHTLGEVSVLDYRECLRKNYRSAAVAGYFGQLLELVLEPDHPEPGMSDLLKRGLGYLSNKGADRRSMLFYEREVARLLGLGRKGSMGILEVYGKMPNSRDHCLDLLPEK
ncbi:MAG: DNA repair protein RecO [Akkermansiaceae bacterium]|jgi:DNA repair protein RecO (recombination protein O)